MKSLFVRRLLPHFGGVHKKHLLIIGIIVHVNWNNCRGMFFRHILVNNHPQLNIIEPLSLLGKNIDLCQHGSPWDPDSMTTVDGTIKTNTMLWPMHQASSYWEENWVLLWSTPSNCILSEDRLDLQVYMKNVIEHLKWAQFQCAYASYQWESHLLTNGKAIQIMLHLLQPLFLHTHDSNS